MTDTDKQDTPEPFIVNLDIEIPAEYLGFPKSEDVDDLDVNVVEFALTAYIEHILRKNKLLDSIPFEAASDLLENVMVNGWEPLSGWTDFYNTEKYGMAGQVRVERSKKPEQCTVCGKGEDVNIWIDGDPYCGKCVADMNRMDDDECIHGVLYTEVCHGPGCEGAIPTHVSKVRNINDTPTTPAPPVPEEPVTHIGGKPIIRSKP